MIGCPPDTKSSSNLHREKKVVFLFLGFKISASFNQKNHIEPDCRRSKMLQRYKTSKFRFKYLNFRLAFALKDTNETEILLCE